MLEFLAEFHANSTTVQVQFYDCGLFHRGMVVLERSSCNWMWNFVDLCMWNCQNGKIIWM